MLSVLHSLLPNEQRTEHKLSVFVFKIICHQTYTYLSNLLHIYSPSPQTRASADTRILGIPICRAMSNGQRYLSLVSRFGLAVRR